MTMLVALFLVLIVSLCAAKDCICAPLAIQNTAQVSFSVGGTPAQLSSNTVTTSVSPLVDVKTVALGAQLDTIEPGVTGYSYSFSVTNTGNIADHFEMTAAFSNISAPVAALWVDNNHNNLLDPTLDTKIDANNGGIALQPGESVSVLVLARANGIVRLTAISLNDDPLAVVRTRDANANVSPRVPPNLNSSQATVTLTKAQSVDNLGGDLPGTGSLITYSLVARVPASVGASNIRIHDTVPSGTTYVPGSLSLDNTALSDAFDSDAGTFDTAAKSISVALPAPDAAQSSATVEHTVRFRVRIN